MSVLADAPANLAELTSLVQDPVSSTRSLLIGAAYKLFESPYRACANRALAEQNEGTRRTQPRDRAHAPALGERPAYVIAIARVTTTFI